MVGNVASRRAGKSLLVIIGTLLFPLFILGGLYARQAWQDVKFLDREIIGLNISEKIYAALLFDDHVLPENDLKVVRTLEAELQDYGDLTFEDHAAAAHESEKSAQVDAVAPNEHDHENEHEHKKAKPLPDGHQHKDAIWGYLVDVGDVSGLILDSEARSFHLANTLVAQLPRTVDSFEALVKRLTGSVVGMHQPATNATEAQQLLGRSYASFEDMEVSIEAARRNSAFVTPQDFEAQKASLNKIHAIIQQTEMKLGQLTFTARGVSDIDKKVLFKFLTDFRHEATTGSKIYFSLLRKFLQERRSLQMRELLTFGSLGLACALFAMLMALAMVRRTFVKLDDVTIHLETADQARRESERVNDEVAKLNVSLSDQMKKLSEAQEEIVRKGRMEQLGHLTATVAHEIRNPLGAVRTSAFLLERKIRGKGLGVETQIERINNGVVRCDNIITQLLDFSRTKQLACRPENLDSWLATAVEEEAAHLPAIVAVSCTLGLDDLEVPFDPARLRRAVSNLMNNASEAMVGAGDDPARFTTTSPRIDVSSQREGDHVVIRITDNGPGISPENLAKIREPLFTTKSFGTGLGVPAVEKILEQHGGFLEIKSIFGEGATFKMYLPATAMVGVSVEAA